MWAARLPVVPGQAWHSQRHLISRSRVIPGKLEAVEALRPSTPIVVTVTNGDRIRSVFKALHPMMLEMTDHYGKDLTVARSDVANIVVSGVSDSSRNGALIGAGIGLAAAAIILGTIGSGDGYVLPSAKWVRLYSYLLLVACWEWSSIAPVATSNCCTKQSVVKRNCRRGKGLSRDREPALGDRPKRPNISYRRMN